MAQQATTGPTLTLTPAAVTQVRHLMEARRMAGLRVSLRKGGCVGLEYRIEAAETPAPDDIVVEQDGARVLIAAKSQAMLAGTRIDYVSDLLESSFRLTNPNVADSCGCGESMIFEPDTPALR
ncbi:MAG: iron-sulfur cluster assembly accessory protein [Rubellimicrobium sp.]|nr:iron-sulfur cluster assembly accessory protein [Rubellimicrobium sp.]